MHNTFLQTLLVVGALVCAYIGNKRDQKGWFYAAGILFFIFVGTYLAQLMEE